LAQGTAVRVADGGRIELQLPAHTDPVLLQIAIWRGLASTEGDSLAATAARLPWVDPGTLRSGGPRVWPEALTLPGRKGFGTGPYVVDSVTVPEDNPWHSWMRLVAIDFFKDGRAAVATWNGDVWLVSGLDDTWRAMTWTRYASGLFEGLGLKIVDGVIHVLERHQITRLHDLNGDGEADYYENFNNDAPIGPSYHAFSFGLDTDRAGRFYFIRCGQRVDPDLPFNGGMIRVSADGGTLEQFAHGMRAANGMSVGPGDRITSADNQGNWIPTSRIDLVTAGGFYGYLPHAHSETVPVDYEKPVCWIPYTLDNSSGGQVWVEGPRWGLPAGNLLHMSYGKGSLFHVMLDEVQGQVQGAAVPIPLRFESGMMRGRFHPVDGQLYLVGLRGWQTSGGRDGALHRVRFTGKPLRMPVGFDVDRQGVAITFSEPLDPGMASDEGNYAVERWNYLWSEAYGSPEFSVKDPGRKGRDPVGIRRIALSADGTTVRMELEDFKPVMQMRIQFKIRARSGAILAGELYPTINRLP
jgi:hypothetical protein